MSKALFCVSERHRGAGPGDEVDLEVDADAAEGVDITGDITATVGAPWPPRIVEMELRRRGNRAIAKIGRDVDNEELFGPRLDELLRVLGRLEMIPWLTPRVHARTRLVFGVALGVIVWVVIGAPMPGRSLREIQPPSWVAASVSVLTSVLVLAVDGLVGRETKAVLVYWRRRHPMPGARAFTAASLNADPRIDKKQLLKSLGGEFPTAPADQNSAWYRLYKKHEGDPVVAGKHFHFLLFRDLTWLTIVLTLLALVNAVVAPFISGRWAELVALTAAFAGLYFLFRKAAKTYGIQFVNQVLVRESQPVTPERQKRTKKETTS